MKRRNTVETAIEEAPYSEDEYRHLVDWFERLEEAVDRRVSATTPRRRWRLPLEGGAWAECEADGAVTVVRRWPDVPDEEVRGSLECERLRIWRVPCELMAPGALADGGRGGVGDGRCLPERWDPRAGWFDPTSVELNRLARACRRCLEQVRATGEAA